MAQAIANMSVVFGKYRSEKFSKTKLPITGATMSPPDKKDPYRPEALSLMIPSTSSSSPSLIC